MTAIHDLRRIIDPVRHPQVGPGRIPLLKTRKSIKKSIENSSHFILSLYTCLKSPFYCLKRTASAGQPRPANFKNPKMIFRLIFQPKKLRTFTGFWSRDKKLIYSTYVEHIGYSDFCFLYHLLLVWYFSRRICNRINGACPPGLF
jgi:hypothetical protein